MKSNVAIKGLASGKTTEYPITENDLNTMVLEFFVLKDVPMAYACFGKGQCKKCCMSDGELSCQITVSELIEKYDGVCELDYL